MLERRPHGWGISARREGLGPQRSRCKIGRGGNVRSGDGRKDQYPGLRTVVVLGAVSRWAVGALVVSGILPTLRVLCARCVSPRCVLRVSTPCVRPLGATMRRRRRERRCRHEAKEEGGEEQDTHREYYTPGGYACARGQGVRGKGELL
jgi:hypothetical protein